MRLLILTQYYPPEIGAPQNRLHELAVRLKANGIHIEVLTALPNYPVSEIMKGYENGKNRYEEIDGIPVYRAWIHVSKSKGIVSRLLNYFSFVWTSYWKGRKMNNFDYLLVESPPLFLGYSAMALAKKLSAKLIFNVSDLWPESAEKLKIVTNKRLLNLAYKLEAKCYRKAHLIIGQTQGIVDDIRARFPEKRVYWLPNGVDVSFYNPAQIQAGNFRKKNGFKPEDVLFFYGGILGHAQGLEVILNAANLLRENSKIHFILQGSGPEKELLLELKKILNLTNVHFLEPVSKKEMPAILKSIDVALVPLKNLPLFQGAIPSKVFEALAMEIPLLLGVDGEARKHFIEKGNAGLFFQPENAEDLAKQALFLAEHPEKRSEMGKNARIYVSEHFDRNKIAAEFFEKLKD
jgi:glycosyltransferase involved in cell wall biosynthesis